MISPAQEIILISSEKSDRALFYTTRGIIESKMTLRDIESLLSPLGFFRTHKGYIVNLSMIHKIQNKIESAVCSKGGTSNKTDNGYDAC